MKKIYHGNILLIEIIIVILFFSIASTISLGVFAEARKISRQTSLAVEAESHAMNLFADIDATSDPQAALFSSGYRLQDGCWYFTNDTLSWQASITTENYPTGSLITIDLSAEAAGTEIRSFTHTIYFPEED